MRCHLLAVALLASAARADIKLPAILGSNMVLQQSTDARLWGWARPGEKIVITTSWSAPVTEVTADVGGNWQTFVRTPASDHKPHTITLKGDNEVTVENILIGEVWVCSGQSNMEWPIRATDNWEEELKSADQPAVRLFTVENTVSADPKSDCKGAWVVATPDTVKNFSAVGYYFSLHTYKQIHAPIGLISSDWGGTPAESWTSATGLAAFPEFAGQIPRPALDAENRATSGRLIDAWIKAVDAVDPGCKDATRWSAADVDDSAWSDATIPGHWADSNFDGLGWYRTTFTIPDSWAEGDATLELGPIDDCDMTWLNGTLIGRTMFEAEGNWQTPRRYKVPAAALKRGTNTLAIRVLDAAGPGGLYGKPGQLVLRSSQGATIPLAGKWKFRSTVPFASLPARPWTPASGIGPHTPTSLYNGMIAPLTPLSIRGVIWYQGESNRDRAFQYRSLFPVLIHDWRARWSMDDNKDFPFYFVQIAPFNYGGDQGQAAELREAQMLTASLPNTGMAVTMDIGNPADIHPTNKKEVGRRLSLWALAKTYGKEVECSGPTMKSFTVQGDRIVIAFDHAEGLTSGDGPPRHFAIAGADKKFVPAKAVIDGKTVTVSADAVPSPLAVRYAWGAADEPNLKNAAGLPASSFRTDDWPGLTQRPAPKSSRLKVESRSLNLAAPIGRWDEAIPLGNGLIGGLLWGEGNIIRLSLDRGDLWDLRVPQAFNDPRWNYAAMQEMVAARDERTFHELFDVPYDTVAYPTKLPVGRLEITLPSGLAASEFQLNLRDAEAMVTLGNQSRAYAFFDATQPVALVRIASSSRSDGVKGVGTELPQLKLIRPKGLDRLGYQPAQEGSDGSSVWLVQRAAGDLTYAIVASMKPIASEAIIAIAITSSADGVDPLALAKLRTSEALSRGYARALEDHSGFWSRHWSGSQVSIPDAQVQAHYDLCRYFYGAASRVNAPPMPLQGVWTADEGGLPPWKGDYHNDLNTQMTYLAYLDAGLFESGGSWLNFNIERLPRYRQFARSFYGVDGAIVPGVMGFDGAPLGGWGMYSLSPTNAAWVAQAFHLHWRYTRDEEFLKSKAYPFCAEVATAIKALLKPDRHGKLKLPLSSSPEIHDNSYRAWLTPNSNYDLSLIRRLFSACQEMAAAQNLTAAAAAWSSLATSLDDLDIDHSGALTFAKGEPYTQSHRHFSHTMAIHPLGLIHMEGSPRERDIINASLDTIISRGTSAWCGYSFGWFSCMLARCGRPEQALDYLERYQRGFILRNGFHCNGDQSGTGMSGLTYRPFTLEGNFLAMQAVHEMLLQSWGGTIRIFPAVSARWGDASFENLCAEGGLRVSAERRNRRTVKVTIQSSIDGPVRIRDPFGPSGTWSRRGTLRDGVLEYTMARGEVITGWSQ